MWLCGRRTVGFGLDRNLRSFDVVNLEIGIRQVFNFGLEQRRNHWRSHCCGLSGESSKAGHLGSSFFR
jgi:hypothetical protein